MSLIPIKKTKITIPEFLLQNKRVGNNLSKRYGINAQEIEVEVYQTSYPGWYELRTNASLPINSFYLQQGLKNKEPILNEFCLKAINSWDISTLNEKTKLKWTQYHDLTGTMNPDEISKSWFGKFNFNEDNPENNQKGLRLPQLGALHSISAHFSLQKSNEPVTVVLPTGTGKTETMLSTMIYKQLSKILVIVPSNSLREQITSKFYGFGCLFDIGIIPGNTLLPAVCLIKNGIRSIDEAKELLSCTNVFIATPDILNSSSPEAVNFLCNGITDLFIDEAHHVSAKTWTKIREKFINKRVIQFTATPFRNDGSNLGGRIIYNYTMGEAQEAGYFKHVKLVPVEEYYSEKSDRVIAQKAIEILKNDIEQGFSHLMMARVSTKTRAEQILPIYQKLAPELNPVVVHSGMGKTKQKEALEYLLKRDSKIVICVNMLGEGFDLPALKISAIHDIHKSLAITLQFIGRFTRHSSSLNLGEASVIVNIADVDVEAGLQNLYSQGAEWDSVLKRLSEERIDREVKLQDVIEKLKQKGCLHKQLSLWNLRPVYSAMLFETKCESWNPEKYVEIIPKDTEHWFALSESENIMVVLALHQSPVQWGKYKDLHDNVYKLLIMKWDKDRSALFIYSNDYNWFRVDKLTKIICNEKAELVSGARVFNIFNGLEYPLVRNLGASQIGAISFTQYFGPNVTEGLNKIEQATSNLSNIAGLGYDDGNKVIWGCSQKKGKIWSVTSGSITDWSEWVTKAWDKIINGNIDETNITKDFLRPERLEKNYSQHASSISWGEYIQSSPEENTFILFGTNEVPLYLVDLEIAVQEENKPYQICIKAKNNESKYGFIIDKELTNGFSYKHLSGDKIKIKKGNGHPKPLEEYLLQDPWILQYVDGSYSYNCFLIKIPENIGEFPSDNIETWDWNGIDIRKESMGKDKLENTIQWRTYQNLLNSDSYDIIVNDDDSGEIADLIGFKSLEDKIYLTFVHCKYSQKDNAGARVEDLYEVCGQTQKSIRWKHQGVKKLYERIKYREANWQKDGATRFLKGSLTELSIIKNRSRTAQVILNIIIVQPGLKKSSVTPDMLRLLGSTANYVKKTTQAELSVIGSP